MDAREPYPWLSDEELDEVIAGWSEDVPEADVFTDPYEYLDQPERDAA